MNDDAQPRTNYSDFAMGMLTGVFVSTGLMMLLAPQMARDVSQKMKDAAAALRDRTSDQYRDVGNRVDDAIGDLTRRGQGVRDDVADAVARGAHEVERFAMAAKSGTTTKPVV